MYLPEANIKYNYDVITKISDEIDVLLGHYAAHSGDTVPKFGKILSVASSRVKNPRRLSPEDGTDRLSRSVVKKLLLLAL
jgi:hypothetical protein